MISKYSSFVLLVVLLLLVLILFLNFKHQAVAIQAQEDNLTMQSRLQSLRAEVEAGNIIINFKFIEPISSTENSWMIGSPDQALEFVEIGEDYFCFSQSSEQAVLIRCVPYSNIASFDYLGT
jgi:hypothetical protein